MSGITTKIESIDQLMKDEFYTIYNPTASKKGETDSSWRWGKYTGKQDRLGRPVFIEYNRIGKTNEEITGTVTYVDGITYYPIYTEKRPAR